MKNKYKIIDILLEHFTYVYCDSCKYNYSEENCDGCHRKSSSWALSSETASEIAEQILKRLEIEDENQGTKR